MKKKEDKFYEILKLNRSRDFKRSSNSLEKDDPFKRRDTNKLQEEIHKLRRDNF